MINLLFGTNSYEIQYALQEKKRSFKGEVRSFDGEELTATQLPDLFIGLQLFSSTQLLVIKRLSKNKTIWSDLPSWLDRLADSTEVILVEDSLDKRTSTYKYLKANATVTEYLAWGDRDGVKAEKWVAQEAKRRSVSLTPVLIRSLIKRVGVDQWQLSAALDILRHVDPITETTIQEVIEANPSENIFSLFETALKGDREKLHALLTTLELTQDPYQLFGLLSTQAVQLVTVFAAEAGNDPSKDFGIHPFVATKLRAYAKKLSRTDIHRLLSSLTQADKDMKQSRADPWIIIEKSLMNVAYHGS